MDSALESLGTSYSIPSFLRGGAAKRSHCIATDRRSGRSVIVPSSKITAYHIYSYRLWILYLYYVYLVCCFVAGSCTDVGSHGSALLDSILESVSVMLLVDSTSSTI